MTSPIAIAAAGAVALAAMAGMTTPAAAQGSSRNCFFSRNLESWREVGDKTVNLRVGVNDVYQLRLVASCPDLPYAEAIGIETQRGSPEICTGLDVSIIVPSSVTHVGPIRCMGTDLRKLSPAEVKALPPKQRP